MPRKQCPTCNGNTKCRVCGGSGKFVDGNRSVNCRTCNGSGNCGTCGGAGAVSGGR
jgi:primosomal protein N'